MATEKDPPGFSTLAQYPQWRQDIEMWQLSTALEPQRQALAVCTKLSGKARAIALKIDSVDLNTDNGMNILLAELDREFQPTAVTTKNRFVLGDLKCICYVYISIMHRFLFTVSSKPMLCLKVSNYF